MSQSQSQQSDFASSLYDGEVEQLTYLAASNPFETPSGSRATYDAFDPEFLRPNPPTLIPLSLTRVGPDRRKTFVLYDNMVYAEWVDWWLQTDYGRRSKIKWDSTRHTAIWEHFDQVAHSADGAPKVMCRRCAKILEHPYTTHTNAEGKDQYHGTSTMTKHLKTMSCRNTKDGKNAEITRFLKKGVRYLTSTIYIVSQWKCIKFTNSCWSLFFLGGSFYSSLFTVTLGRKYSTFHYA